MWVTEPTCVGSQTKACEPPRNVGCTPFVASIPFVGNTQGHCLSLYFSWLSLGVALDGRRAAFFVPSLEASHASVVKVIQGLLVLVFGHLLGVSLV
jgi:hypothetical protein